VIVGYAFVVFGYAVFYWGVHHFPGVDCETQNGCRYSLWDVMGVPSSWQISHGTPIQINPGGSASASTPTQPQTPSNAKTPSSATKTPTKTTTPTAKTPSKATTLSPGEEQKILSWFAHGGILGNACDHIPGCRTIFNG
jgi:cell division septation protein DedD